MVRGAGKKKEGKHLMTYLILLLYGLEHNTNILDFFIYLINFSQPPFYLMFDCGYRDGERSEPHSRGPGMLLI